jgi:type III secretion protein V
VPRKDLILVGLLMAILALMVIPLPTWLIDILLAINMSLSIILLIVAIYLKRPSDFSTFPSVILIATAFRLALSIAITRLILSQADAGEIVATFGEYVIGGSVVIGLVIFLIITVVQFIVVTKGTERVAEVAARFALDAMPGKQMSIEADIRAGTIDQEKGGELRRGLEKDSQFFGAMDGAMKFVKGDAVAGLIIIFINLLGGIAVGTTVHGYSFSEAASIYSLLTIGDGLVAQIPALLTSLCAGIVVTRVGSEDSVDLASAITREVVSDARVPAAASFVIFAFGLVPGFPFAIFATAAVALLVTATLLRRALRKKEAADTETALADSLAANATAEVVSSDRIGVRLSGALSKDLDLPALRSELGGFMSLLSNRYGVEFQSPYIVCSENSGASRHFQIELDEVSLKTSVIPEGQIITPASLDELRATGWQKETAEVVEWMPGRDLYRYVDRAFKERLTASGLGTVSLEYALAERLFRALEQNIGRLFSHVEYDTLMAEARNIDADLVESIAERQTAPKLIRVFRYLLEDGVPLRPLRLLLESLAYWTEIRNDADPLFLAECIRSSLKRQLCQNLASPDGELGIIMLAPKLQNRIVSDLKSLQKLGNIAEIDGLPLDPDLCSLLITEVRGIRDRDIALDRRVAIATSPELRRRLRSFLANADLHIPVISPHEIGDEINTIPIGVIGEGYKDTLEQASVYKPDRRAQWGSAPKTATV